MNDVKAKITFLHNARPLISQEKYSNITVLYPAGALPGKGDIIQIDGITHPEGAFVVSHRVFSSENGSLHEVTLTLGIEGKC